MSKALLVRNSEWISKLIEKLLDLFSDHCINKYAAEALGEIGKPDIYILTKQNYAVVKVG